MTACILLSTFNGELYLREQIESVLGQSVEDLRLVIRDDGSTDATISILKSYSNDTRVEVHYGSNIGVVASFFELLKIAPEAEFYSLCDQDDWWEPNKLRRASAVLGEFDSGFPAGVVCRLAVADESLRVEFQSQRPPRGYTLRNALIENVITGCALSVNAAARRLVVDTMPDARKVIMHDWWIYLVLAAAGQVYFEDDVGVIYRQHDRNVIGATRGLALLRTRFGRFLRNQNQGRIRRQVEEFFRCFHGKLCRDQRKIITELIDLLSERRALNRAIKAAFSLPAYRQGRRDTTLFIALVVLGRV